MRALFGWFWALIFPLKSKRGKANERIRKYTDPGAPDRDHFPLVASNPMLELANEPEPVLPSLPSTLEPPLPSSAHPTQPLAPQREAVPMTSLPFDNDNKRIIKIILSIFETGTFEPDYGSVTVLNDKHGITYGAHQSTDGGESSLDKICARYIELGGIYAADIAPFMDRLRADATTASTPDNIEGWVLDLMGILARAGDEDPLMAQAQEEVFETEYWQPALQQFLDMGLATPLAMLVCYDSTIHSGKKGIGRIRKMFPEGPPATGGDEEAWTVAYLRARRSWLMSIERLQVTVYRIDSMLELARTGNWNLDTPVAIQKPRATVS